MKSCPPRAASAYTEPCDERGSRRRGTRPRPGAASPRSPRSQTAQVRRRPTHHPRPSRASASTRPAHPLRPEARRGRARARVEHHQPRHPCSPAIRAEAASGEEHPAGGRQRFNLAARLGARADSWRAGPQVDHRGWSAAPPPRPKYSPPTNSVSPDRASDSTEPPTSGMRPRRRPVTASTAARLCRAHAANLVERRRRRRASAATLRQRAHEGIQERVRPEALDPRVETSITRPHGRSIAARLCALHRPEGPHEARHHQPSPVHAQVVDRSTGCRCPPRATASGTSRAIASSAAHGVAPHRHHVAGVHGPTMDRRAR